MNNMRGKEEVYVDWDEETALWCVFGTETGYCYATYASKENAEVAANSRNEMRLLQKKYGL